MSLPNPLYVVEARTAWGSLNRSRFSASGGQQKRFTAFAVLTAMRSMGQVVCWIALSPNSERRQHCGGRARQYCGWLGKQDNCRVAVSLSDATWSASLPSCPACPWAPHLVPEKYVPEPRPAQKREAGQVVPTGS